MLEKTISAKAYGYDQYGDQYGYRERVEINTFVYGDMSEIKRTLTETMSYATHETLEETGISLSYSRKLQHVLDSWEDLEDLKESLGDFSLGDSKKIKLLLPIEVKDTDSRVGLAWSISTIKQGEKLSLLLKTRCVPIGVIGLTEYNNVVQNFTKSSDSIKQYALADLAEVKTGDQAVVAFAEHVLSANPSNPHVKLNALIQHLDVDKQYKNYILVNEKNTLIVLFAERFASRGKAHKSERKAALCLPTGIYSLGGTETMIIKSLSENNLKTLLSNTDLSLAGSRLGKSKYQSDNKELLANLVVKSMGYNDSNDSQER